MRIENQRYRTAVTLLLALCLFSAANSQVKLPALVRDSMVLQRDVKIPVWGWASPGEKIKIEFRGKTVTTTADADGRWYTKLKAYHWGGPFEMKISGENNEINLKDILIGDVFICSGQSNMEKTVDDFYAADIAVSANDNIRQFKVTRQGADTVLEDLRAFTGWKPASPTTLKSFTSAGYFFAKDLYDKYGVPVGLINSSYGAALAEAWTSREGLKDFPAFYTQAKSPIVQSNPMVLYNAMMAPLTKYAVRGILWYQGEFNKNRAYQYRTLFPALINDWRQKFNQGTLPFIFVQLPNYDPVADVPKESATAELREAQAMALALPNTAMAVTIETNSNTDLHPKEKKPVGIRLSLAAQRLIYGDKKVPASPLYAASAVEGHKIIIRFSNADKGLVAKNGEPKQFTIAGADRKFVYATAVIHGNTVEVSSPQVPQPAAVRYAWADNPVGANLYNTEGLPAGPFRTDAWPGITKPK